MTANEINTGILESFGLPADEIPLMIKAVIVLEVNKLPRVHLTSLAPGHLTTNQYQLNDVPEQKTV